ncbi:MAG: hypothetical protein OHK0031_12500 [Anaerolineales bacterium]
MKKISLLLVFCLLMAASPALAAAPAAPRRVDTDPYSLIAAVNALRAASGLPAYSVNPILMAIAQQQAEFMSVNGVSHDGYGGTRPFQRALNAGYPLAGDLALGGFMSENITAGSNKSVQEAVSEWQGDAPHLNTMLSPNMQEIGAGVAIVGDYVYYVIDCARPTGSGSVAYTPAPGGAAPIAPGAPLVSTIFPATPLADGNLYHLVKPGETLWLIAISYGVKVAEIRQLNGMSEADAIYPGEKLLIQKSSGTLTPAPQTASPTLSEAATPTVFSPPTAISAAPTTPSTPPAQPAAPRENSLLALGAILLAAILSAAALMLRK